MKRILFSTLLLCTTCLLFQAVPRQQDDTRKFITDYFKALNDPDWQQKVRFAFATENGWKNFVTRHQEFRNAFTNYHSNIDFIVIEGNKGSVWVTVTGEFAQPYAQEELKNAEARQQKVKWEEAWYFEIKDGHWAGNFRLLLDGVGRMKQLGVKCLPE